MNYYEKALKILFGHRFCAPLALRPGTTVPGLPPRYATVEIIIDVGGPNCPN